MKTTFDWNPLDPASIRNPYPIYKEPREHIPAYWHAGMNSWVLTRYDDCQMMLRDHTNFARDRRRIGEDIPDERLNIQKQDPPEQATLRRITTKSLNVQKLQQICSEGQALMEERLPGLAGTGPFDLMPVSRGPGSHTRDQPGLRGRLIHAGHVRSGL